MIIEDDVFRIEPGKVAEFSMSREELVKLLETLPEEVETILFKMDSRGKVSVYRRTE